MKKATNLYERKFKSLLKKEREEDENTVGDGALGTAAGVGHGGMYNTDWYAPSDSRVPMYLGTTSRLGKSTSKRRRKKKSRKRRKNR